MKAAGPQRDAPGVCADVGGLPLEVQPSRVSPLFQSWLHLPGDPGDLPMDQTKLTGRTRREPGVRRPRGREGTWSPTSPEVGREIALSASPRL